MATDRPGERRDVKAGHAGAAAGPVARCLCCGETGPLPAPGAPLPFATTEQEQAKMARMRADRLIGTPDKVKSRIVELAKEMQADEVALVTWAHEPEARRQSYRLIAEAFGLEG